MSAQATSIPNAADVEEALRDVIDPELGINVVDLGLVYGVAIDPNNHVVIDMTLTSAACPLTDVIEDQAGQALDGLVAGFRINWVWMPPWGPSASPRTAARSCAPWASTSEAWLRPRTGPAGPRTGPTAPRRRRCRTPRACPARSRR